MYEAVFVAKSLLVHGRIGQFCAEDIAVEPIRNIIQIYAYKNVCINNNVMFIACGGMDNMCTVYDVNNRDSTGAAKMVRELAGYEGFLSSCRFLDDTHILTGSGDMKM